MSSNAMYDGLGLHVGFRGLFGRPEGSQVRDDPVLRNLCCPTASVLGYAKYSGRASLVSPALISCVQFSRCFTQILEGVVARIAINVVNVLARPFASHVQPRKSVCPVISAVDHDATPAVLVGVAGNSASLVAWTRSVPQAPKDARLRIIGKHFTQPRCGEEYDIHGDIIGGGRVFCG